MFNTIPGKKEIVSEILKACVGAQGVDELATVLHSHLSDILPCRKSAIAYASDNNMGYIIKILDNREDLTIQSVFMPGKSFNPFSGLKSAVCVNDLTSSAHSRLENPVFQEFMSRGARSLLYTPLFKEKVFFGALFLGSNYSGAYGKAHISIVEYLSPFIASVLNNHLSIDLLQKKCISLEKAISRSCNQSKAIQMDESQELWDKTWKDWEIYILTKTISQCNGRIYGPRGAAGVLKIPPTTLQGKLKKLGLNRKGITGLRHDRTKVT